MRRIQYHICTTTRTTHVPETTQTALTFLYATLTSPSIQHSLLRTPTPLMSSLQAIDAVGGSSIPCKCEDANLIGSAVSSSGLSSKRCSACAASSNALGRERVSAELSPMYRERPIRAMIRHCEMPCTCMPAVSSEHGMGISIKRRTSKTGKQASIAADVRPQACTRHQTPA
jgi:hypothetical protein